MNDEPSHDLVKIEATFGSSKRISCHCLKAVILRVHQPLLRKEFESTLDLRMVCYRRPTVKQDFRPIDLFSFDEGFSLGSFVAGVKDNISEGLALQIWIECVAHQMFIVRPLALSFIPIGSKLIESPLKVVLLLDFPVIDFVFPVVPEVGEYFPFHLAELDFMEFVGIHGLVESSVPFPHVVDFHQLEMSLLHFLAKLLYLHRSHENAQSLFVQFSLVYTFCDQIPIFVNFSHVPHLFETLLEGLTEQVLRSELQKPFETLPKNDLFSSSFPDSFESSILSLPNDAVSELYSPDVFSSKYRYPSLEDVLLVEMYRSNVDLFAESDELGCLKHVCEEALPLDFDVLIMDLEI